MKNIILALVIAILGVFTFTQLPVFADDKGDCVNTAILGGGEVCDKGGSSVEYYIRFTVDILSIGVGIVGVVALIIVGIQYLTAGGNEEQTRKAKRRIFEIIIGLVAFVLMYAILKWLLPGAKF